SPGPNPPPRSRSCWLRWPGRDERSPSLPPQLEAELQPERVGGEDRGGDGVRPPCRLLVLEPEHPRVDHPVAAGRRSRGFPHRLGPLRVELQRDRDGEERRVDGELER